MTKRIAVAITFLLVAGVTSWSFAQSSPSDLERATVAFDLQMGKMRNGELMKMLDVEKELAAAQESGQLPGEIDLTKVERVFGAMSLPDDLATFQEMSVPGAKDFPFNMFVRVQFANKETTDVMFKSIVEKADVVELEGREFYAPNEEGSPTNVVMHRVDDQTIEMGTKDYLLQEKRKELFSEGLTKAWGKVPDHAFRMAFDMKGEAALLAEAVAMGKATVPDATTQAYLDLVDNATDLRLSIDLDSPNLVVLAATGVDEEQAEKLRSGLDSVMGIAKFTGQKALGGIPDPAAAEVAGEILESLAATADGTNVQIAIPKPDGFNAAIKQMVDQLKQMQEGPGNDESGDSDGLGSDG